MTKMDRLIKANPGKRIAITLNGSIRVAGADGPEMVMPMPTLGIVGSAFSVDRFLEAHQQGKKQTPQVSGQAGEWYHQQADNQPQAASQPAQVQQTTQQQQNVSQRASAPVDAELS